MQNIETISPSVPEVLRTATIREHATIVNLRDWIAAQAPWRLPVRRAVARRIRAA